MTNKIYCGVRGVPLCCQLESPPLRTAFRSVSDTLHIVLHSALTPFTVYRSVEYGTEYGNAKIRLFTVPFSINFHFH